MSDLLISLFYATLAEVGCCCVTCNFKEKLIKTQHVGSFITSRVSQRKYTEPGFPTTSSSVEMDYHLSHPLSLSLTCLHLFPLLNSNYRFVLARDRLQNRKETLCFSCDWCVCHLSSLVQQRTLRQKNALLWIFVWGRSKKKKHSEKARLS